MGVAPKGPLGVRFRRQAAIGKWFLDFYCPEALLNVEVDGEQHELRREKDGTRDIELARLGIVTLRISSMDLHGSRQVRAIERICQALSERTGREIRPRSR